MNGIRSLRWSSQGGAIEVDSVPRVTVAGRGQRRELAPRLRPQAFTYERRKEMFGGKLGQGLRQKVRRFGIEMEGVGPGQLPIALLRRSARLAHRLRIFHLDGDEGWRAVAGDAAHLQVEGGVITEKARVASARRMLEGDVAHLSKHAWEEAFEDTQSEVGLGLATGE